MVHRRLGALAVALASALACPAHATELARVSAGTALPDGVRRVEDYGRFRLIEASAEALASLRATGNEVEWLPDGYRLTLPFDVAVDPQVRAPWDRHQRLAFPAGEVFLLQFHGPSKPEWLAALAADGIEVIQYLHPYAYLVFNRSGRLGAHAAEAEAVRWVGEYPASARLALPAATTASESLQVLRMLVYRGAGLDAARLPELGAMLVGRAVIDPVMEDWHVAIAGTSASLLAGLPGVLSVQDLPTDGGLRGELSNQHFAGNVGANDLPLPDYPAWLAGIGFNGNGVQIANVDGGVDQTHPNLVNRMRPCTGTTCGGNTASSHGTHTAGTMAADGSNGVRDANGFLRGLGVAPGATLIEQVYSPFFQQPGGMLLLMRESAANGSYLSGNSWGPAGSPRGYDADTRQVDVGTRDTDPDTPGDQPLLYVLSIMNGNGGTSTQGTPDEAKNVLTVGSTNSQSTSGAPLTTWKNLSGNSGHGPALDGRLIPHLVAPGCRVDSTTPSSNHGLSCGTSMASPHVSGAMALFAQAYQARHGTRPSAALAKAFAIGATVDLFGGTDANGNPLTRRPNARQGFGALRGNQMFGNWPRTRSLDQTQVFTATGQEWTQAWPVREATAPVQVVLTWTDAPGHGLCNGPSCTTPAWNNDLDLVVEVGDQSYKGNVFASDGFSAPGGSADFRNNIELVSLPAGTSGPLTIRVLAQNLTSDALPNSPGAIQQDFALVCTNCSTGPGSYSVQAPEGSIGACAGQNAPAVPLRLVTPDGASDPVTLSTPGAPAAFGSASFTPNPAVPSASGTLSTLVVAIQAGATPGTHLLPVRGVSPAGQQDATVSYAVVDASPGPTTPSAPADGASGVATTATLSWGAVAGAQRYRIELARNADFSALTAEGTTTGTSVAPRLRANTVYHWRVRAENACGHGAYASQSFTTEVGDAVFSDGFLE